MTRLDIQDLAKLRLEEAEALFAAGKFDGYVYLCGYVVELGLKAVICRILDLAEYPDSKPAFKVHSFDDLSLLAGLKSSIVTLPGPLDLNWLLLTRWNSGFRYAPRNTYNQSNAREWLNALRHPENGVLAWLETRW